VVRPDWRPLRPPQHVDHSTRQRCADERGSNGARQYDYVVGVERDTGARPAKALVTQALVDRAEGTTPRVPTSCIWDACGCAAFRRPSTITRAAPFTVGAK